MYAGRENKGIGSSPRLGYFANLFVQRRLFIITLIALIIIGIVLGFTFFYPNNAQGETDPAPTITNFTLNSGDTYANASTRIVTASGTINDLGGTGTLQVQFSEDRMLWGKYSGNGSVNNKGQDWTYYATITAQAFPQNIANAWYLEDPNEVKTLYIRAKDDAGNISGYPISSDSFTTSTPDWFNDEAVTTADWDSTAGHIQLEPNLSNVFVSDRINNRVQKFDLSGNFIMKWGGFSSPEDLALDSLNNVYVVDFANYRIQKFDSSGNFITQWGSYGTGSAQFKAPSSIAIDSNDNVYVSDRLNWKVKKFTSSGSYITSWGSNGTGNGQFTAPNGITVDSNDNVYVSEGFGNYRVQKFSSNGAYISKWGSGGTGNGQFKWPGDLAVDSSNNIYVIDYNNYRIQKFTSTGTFITKWGSYGESDGQLKSPRGITVDANDDVWVSGGAAYAHRIQKFSSNGAFISKWGSRGSGDGQLNQPRGIAILEATEPYVPSGNIVQSKTLDLTTDVITSATLSATENNDPGTSVDYQMSRDGGQSWADITSGVQHIFTSPNSEKSNLKWKATLNGTANATPKIEDISITYEQYADDFISLDGTKPTSPGNLSTTSVTNTQIAFDWSASFDTGGSGLAGYKVDKATDNAGSPGIYSQLGVTADILYDDSDVGPNTKYWYRVKSYDNADNNSNYSLDFAVTTLPSPPTNVLATDGTLADQIQVSWQAPIIASEYDHFHVYKDSPTGIPINETSGTVFTDSVADDNLHTYYVYSVNSEDVENPLLISDTGFRAIKPSAPTIGTSQALSEVSIQWNFTDNASDESLYT